MLLQYVSHHQTTPPLWSACATLANFLSLMMPQLWQNFLGKFFWDGNVVFSQSCLPRSPTKQHLLPFPVLLHCHFAAVCMHIASPLLNICKFTPSLGISISRPWHQQKSKYLQLMQISRLRTGRFWWRLRRRAGATFAPVSVATAVARAVARPSRAQSVRSQAKPSSKFL